MALHVLAYNLTPVMNMIGTQSLISANAICARISRTLPSGQLAWRSPRDLACSRDFEPQLQTDRIVTERPVADIG